MVVMKAKFKGTFMEGEVRAGRPGEATGAPFMSVQGGLAPLLAIVPFLLLPPSGMNGTVLGETLRLS